MSPVADEQHGGRMVFLGVQDFGAQGGVISRLIAIKLELRIVGKRGVLDAIGRDTFLES